MNNRIIEIKESIYKDMKFIDLRDVSEELQWKLLEYHNQGFILNRIVGSNFTEDEHRKFLSQLDDCKRKHYIVFYKGKAIGKYSFIIEDNIVYEPGNYLFYEENLKSGLGLLKVCFFHKYVFEILCADKIIFSVLKSNTNQHSFVKRLGAVVTNSDDETNYYVLTSESYFRKKEKLESLLMQLV